MRQRQQRQESLARLLRYILCHHPDEFGLVLDKSGRLAVKELLRALGQEEGWRFVRRSHLEEVVNLINPGDFELDQTYIRALHPQPAELRSQEAAWPPPLLYRAITANSHHAVAERGLQPPSGGELVLADNQELAKRLGQRRDPQAIMVIVQAQAAAKRGVNFFSYGPKLYLSDAIAPEYLQLPPTPKKPVVKPAAADKKPPAPPAPGAIWLNIQGEPIKPWKEKGRQKDPGWKKAARTQRRQKTKK
ncbi:RNA 2'-phosphotransferase [Desulfobacca acetoxidans]|uniref:Phosphotransferase KptA/Tpt1 n=1 Tax=Desulfobacca acetoxidans (strain ATCC 700848 / DSM 11109 / ASRB2) TaxID=880072 RepID=F2NCF3_DESAR|nr:RNA 2'-phosphotransferase [Desulfobacca acetoxidans]AEB09017.1 phosphotransferase KptA/Tpt1 [Desulfobacca acetoxidans DSM 11109]